MSLRDGARAASELGDVVMSLHRAAEHGETTNFDAWLASSLSECVAFELEVGVHPCARQTTLDHGYALEASRIATM